jgi:hypothetical protein
MKFNWRNVLIALGLILLMVLLVDFNRRMEDMDRMNTQLDTVRAQATEVMQTQVALLTQVAYANSDESVEQWAYTNKWVRVDENPISIVPLGDVTPTPVPSPVSQTTDLPKWRLWLELFFGKRQ